MEPLNGDNFEWIGEVRNGQTLGRCVDCLMPFSQHIKMDMDTMVGDIPVYVQVCPPSNDNYQSKLN